MNIFRLLAIVILAVVTIVSERAVIAASAAQSLVTLQTPPPGTLETLRWMWNSDVRAASDEPTCPNLVVDPGEDCDDGNLFDGDGCDTTCHYEPAICGNAVLNPDEGCDDGNLVANDGCDPECGLEPAVCGNGLLEPDEECDDGNLISGDGCDASCSLEGVTGNRLSVGTSTGNDTLYEGVPGSLVFKVESSATTPVAGFVFPMEYHFSNGNIIGPIAMGAGAAYMTYSPKAHETLAFVGWNRSYAGAATNPSATLLGLTTLGPNTNYWTGSGELWRITFTPLGTGTITIDSTNLPPSNTLAMYNYLGEAQAYQWQKKTITVVAGMPTGNVNGDGAINSADLVYLVNYLYREGTSPAPCEAEGDVDCSGIINTLDIMKSINYVFKAGQKPCNVRGLVGAGVWNCP